MATRTITGNAATLGASASTRSLLRLGLTVDALASGAVGAVILPAAGWLDGHLGLPAGLLAAAGLAMLVAGALYGVVATRSPTPLGAARVIVALNLLWVAGSVGLLISGAVEPTGLGYAFVVAQAAAVVVFSELQILGLRRERTAA